MDKDKEQIIIDTNKYFVELIDEGGGTVDYTVMFPERLLIEIIKQNKQLARKTQECEELEERLERTEEDLKYQCADCMNIKSDLYRKALEEIEEIVKSFNINGLCFYNEIDECDCCDMGADCNYLRRAKILYIINKAKGEGND